MTHSVSFKADGQGSIKNNKRIFSILPTVTDGFTKWTLLIRERFTTTKNYVLFHLLYTFKEARSYGKCESQSIPTISGKSREIREDQETNIWQMINWLQNEIMGKEQGSAIARKLPILVVLNNLLSLRFSILTMLKLKYMLC